MARDKTTSRLDFDRKKRRGFGETIYGEGKTIEHLADCIRTMLDREKEVFITRLEKDRWDQLGDLKDLLDYDPISKTAGVFEEVPTIGEVAVVTAGTADVAVAEESVRTLDYFHIGYARCYDVGVAGIHRLFSKLEAIRKADVVIVVAGMDGALPSVVAGLIESPLIAVPTSVGYGAAFQGVAPLLGMLNSCAEGVSVVNIDNGFGAAYAAAQIVRKIYEKRR